jgi:hypothetical protein
MEESGIGWTYYLENSLGGLRKYKKKTEYLVFLPPPHPPDFNWAFE